MNRIIFHIDVNSAYLSWTALQMLEDGSAVDLRDVPAIIGGDMEKRHGVVLAKSIPAKAYGISTGEPVVNAIRKCPVLTAVAPDHILYEEKSRALIHFLSTICPDIEQTSIDECYMDFTSVAACYPSPEAAAAFIKDAVFSRFHFTVNIGISDRKVLAKMASDFKKPNLVHTLYSHEINTKMWPLPVSSLFMCGHSSVAALRNLGILTIGDLAQADSSIIAAHLKSHGRLLWEYANGIDSSEVMAEPVKHKGVGNSTTLSKDITERTDICRTLLWLAESVSTRLRASHEIAGMVSTEIKYSTFECISHQRTLPVPSASTDIIYQTALSLFDEIWNTTPIRLLGIRTSKLLPENEPLQLNLFDLDTETPAAGRLKKLDAALDAIRGKYGAQSVIRGSLLERPEDCKSPKE